MAGGMSERSRALAEPAVRSRSRVWASICSYVALMRPLPASATSARWNARSWSAAASQSLSPIAPLHRVEVLAEAIQLDVGARCAIAFRAPTSSASRTA